MANMRAIHVMILVVYCGASGMQNLRPLSYLQLPATVSTRGPTYKLDSGAARESAYDKEEALLYVLGDKSKMLHIIDLYDPSNPTLLMSHHFTVTDGRPLDVEMCRYDDVAELAVSLAHPIDETTEGHIHFYEVFGRGDKMLQQTAKITVGAYPDNIEYTRNCSRLIVANEGSPGIDITKSYQDPEGTVTVIIRQVSGGFTSRTIDFKTYNTRQDIRFVTIHAPGTIPARAEISKDIEPEYIALSHDDRYAYITLQENNAIATVDIENGVVKSVMPLPWKDWSRYSLDTSDEDGGHRYDELSINNSTFYNELAHSNRLGRLYVSDIDGMDFRGQLDDVYSFGGRGFSIWKVDSQSGQLSLVFDSGDEIEYQASLQLPHVFNSDFVYTTVHSPENLRDTASDDMGPKLSTLDVIEDDGVIYLVVGSETMGTIFLYTIGITDGDIKPEFQCLHRAGATDYPWTDLYDMKQTGDARISDIRLIPSSESPTGQTLLYVVGAGSGSVSVYEVLKDTQMEKQTKPRDVFLG